MSDTPAATQETFDRGLRIALAVAIPVVLFCAIYAAMQARFVARDTAALRNEVEALHAQVVKIQKQPQVGVRTALPSPRPSTPRKGKKNKAGSSDDGEAAPKAAKAGKRKGGKAKAKAKASAVKMLMPSQLVRGKK